MIIIKKIPMLQIYTVLLIALSLCSQSLYAAAVLADPATDQSSPAQYNEAAIQKQSLDPTIDFFMALSSCTPGSYQERNILSNTHGAEYLQQQILGEDEGVCSVILSTPDRRYMECLFSSQDIEKLSDLHFLNGIFENSPQNQSQSAKNADAIWTGMKNQRCTFIENQ